MTNTVLVAGATGVTLNLGETLQRPVLLSTIKLRQAGFHECRDSEVSLRRWIRELQVRRLIPG